MNPPPTGFHTIGLKSFSLTADLLVALCYQFTIKLEYLTVKKSAANNISMQDS
jgi:hypothetical protein